MLPGQAERRTRDYKGHGTTSLFAALDIATGSLIGKCWPRHRAIEFRKFLNQIDRAVPADRSVHLVLDNYATHKMRGSCGTLATACTSLPRTGPG
jgi:DDE superfamily endonuclease